MAGLVLSLVALMVMPAGAGMSTASLDGEFGFYRMARVLHGAPSPLGTADRGNFGANDRYSVGIEDLSFDGAGIAVSDYASYDINREFLDAPIDGNTLMANYHNTSTITHSGFVTGTYSVTRDGTFSHIADAETHEGYVSEDGNIILYGKHEFEEGDSWASCELGVGIKKGSGLDGTLLDGQYTVAFLETSLNGLAPRGNCGITEDHTLSTNQATFDGAGQVDMIMTPKNIERTILDHQEVYAPPDVRQIADYVLRNYYTTTSGIMTGTALNQLYTVTSDGGLTMTIESKSIEGQVSADGNIAVLGSRDWNSTAVSFQNGFGVAIRRGTGFTLADLKGTYVVGIYGIEFNGTTTRGNFGVNDLMSLERKLVTFDGAGHIKIVGDGHEVFRSLQDYAGAPGATLMTDYVWYNRYSTVNHDYQGAETGTYSVTDDGTVTLTINQDGGGTESVQAYLSADGKAILVTEVVTDYSTRVYGEFGFGAKVVDQTIALPALPLLLLDN
jgi:hypothetical protein